MSSKTFIISASFAAAAAVLGFWLFAGETSNRNAVVAQPHAVRPALARNLVKTSPSLPTTGEDNSASSATNPPTAESRQRPVPALPLTVEELTARAARVEQEANHDLRRLVELLDLSEDQQDKVFRTLAQHSPSWTPELQFAAVPDTGVGPMGKRAEIPATVPGLVVTPVAGDSGPVKTPENAKTPAPSTGEEPAAATDSTDEIMALLDPYQQDTLLQEELNRAAWWAEILEQITPPADFPSLDGSPPAPPAGESQAYEGSNVLE